MQKVTQSRELDSCLRHTAVGDVLLQNLPGLRLVLSAAAGQLLVPQSQLLLGLL